MNLTQPSLLESVDSISTTHTSITPELAATFLPIIRMGLNYGKIHNLNNEEVSHMLAWHLAQITKYTT